jgi:hypothetical protein
MKRLQTRYYDDTVKGHIRIARVTAQEDASFDEYKRFSRAKEIKSNDLPKAFEKWKPYRSFTVDGAVPGDVVRVTVLSRNGS